MNYTSSLSSKLRTLLHELLSREESEAVNAIIDTWPISYAELVIFDNTMGGPGFSNVNCDKSGRYDIDDRDIFRPLQYIGHYFLLAVKDESAGAWLARDIVQAGGIQLESIIKRIAQVDRLPLGQALMKPLARLIINPLDWQRIQQYTTLYNAAKHNLDQPKDTHLFSFEEAILSYFIVRKLATNLYPLAKMKTDLKVFNQQCP